MNNTQILKYSLSFHYFQKIKKMQMWILLGVVTISLLIAFCSLFAGAYDLSLSDVLVKDSVSFEILFNLRLPRMLMGFFVGAGLAIVGATLQVLFANPLADSGLIGISAGSMAMVVAFTVLGSQFPILQEVLYYFKDYAFSFLAFIGGLILVSTVYKLSLIAGKVDIQIMLLAGIAMNAFAGAFAGLMIYMASDTELRNITFWTMGSLNGVTWRSFIPVGLVISVGSYFLLRLKNDIYTFMAGEKQAICMGLDIDHLKKKVLILCALIAGVSVAETGMIGFVGLVVPHIIRAVFKNYGKLTFILSFFIGGSFLILADVFSRTIVLPAELPIGTTTSLIGAPYFVFLLYQIKRGKNA